MVKRLPKMPPINRYPSRRAWEDDYWKKIAGSKELMEMLATPYERRNLVMRAAVMDRISSGKKYRQIAEELWLSPQTISSIKKTVSGESYRSYWERSKTERKKRVYSRNTRQVRKKPRGRPVRTKYGIIYLP